MVSDNRDVTDLHTLLHTAEMQYSSHQNSSRTSQLDAPRGGIANNSRAAYRTNLGPPPFATMHYTLYFIIASYCERMQTIDIDRQTDSPRTHAHTHANVQSDSDNYELTKIVAHLRINDS